MSYNPLTKDDHIQMRQIRIPRKTDKYNTVSNSIIIENEMESPQQLNVKVKPLISLNASSIGEIRDKNID